MYVIVLIFLFIHSFFEKIQSKGFLTKTTDKNYVFVRRDTRKGHQFSNKNVVFASFPQTKILFLLRKPLENLVSWKGYPSLQKYYLKQKKPDLLSWKGYPLLQKMFDLTKNVKHFLSSQAFFVRFAFFVSKSFTKKGSLFLSGFFCKAFFEVKATTTGLRFSCLFLPFSAFFCLFRRKRMKKDEKG